MAVARAGDRDALLAHAQVRKERGLHLRAPDLPAEVHRADRGLAGGQRRDAPGGAALADGQRRGVPAAQGVQRGLHAREGKGRRPGAHVLRRGGRLAHLHRARVGRLGLVIAQSLLRQGRHAARVRVEPGLDRLPLAEDDQAARLLDRLADAVVHLVHVVGLRLADVRGELRARVPGAAVLDKAQRERARDDGLRLERLQRPVVVHLARQDPGQIALKVHGLHDLFLRQVHLDQRHPVVPDGELLRERIIGRRLRGGRRRGRGRGGGSRPQGGRGSGRAPARRCGAGAARQREGEQEQKQRAFHFLRKPLSRRAGGKPDARSGPSIPGPRHFLARALEKHLARRKANCYH